MEALFEPWDCFMVVLLSFLMKLIIIDQQVKIYFYSQLEILTGRTICILLALR